jgi:hypothetical protein
MLTVAIIEEFISRKNGIDCENADSECLKRGDYIVARKQLSAESTQVMPNAIQSGDLQFFCYSFHLPITAALLVKGYLLKRHSA